MGRIGSDCPFHVGPMLARAGIAHTAIRTMPDEQLIEWLIYEEDGSRRTLPRNPSLRGVGGEGLLALDPFFDLLLAMSPAAEDIPAGWLPAAALHLCPQVGDRHRTSLGRLSGAAAWISVDPSPYYSRNLDAAGLAAALPGCTAVMPSAQEVRPLLDRLGPADAALALHQAGFAEAVIKNGADPTIVAARGRVDLVPVRPVPVVDPTGAGDAFCGAYAACRLLGHEPVAAAERAALSAARVVGCSGAEAALNLTPFA